MYVYIETFGCSANQNNGEIIAGLLARAGFTIVQNQKLADIVILNTCIVKGPTMQRMLSKIKAFSSYSNRLVVTGCMPDVFSEKIAKIAPKASLLGSHHFIEIVKVVKNAVQGKQLSIISKNHEIRLCKPKVFRQKVIGITQISQGCLGNCSYCVVRHAKGKLFSYLGDQIIKSIQQDLAAGCKEVWLTSQDCAAYGMEKSKSSKSRFELPNLLKKILFLKGNFFLRLGMSNPNNILQILDDLIEIYKNKKMFKFLHLPLQSGSDKILADMNRNYSAKDFSFIIKKFKSAIPGLTVSTDIIVGYPAETDKDFSETLELIKQTSPDIINISRFWPMPKTSAALLTPLSAEKIKERTKQAMALHQKIAFEKNKEAISKKYSCLVDEKSFSDFFTCRNSFYKPILIRSKEKILGKLIDVKIVDASPHYLIGEKLNYVKQKEM